MMQTMHEKAWNTAANVYSSYQELSRRESEEHFLNLLRTARLSYLETEWMSLHTERRDRFGE